MPCGKERVVHYDEPEQAVKDFARKVRTGMWFGFPEVDIEVPRELWEQFEEFPPLFINQAVPNDCVSQHMHDYLQESGRTRFPDQKKLLGALSAKKMLIYAPLLQWYLFSGLKITAVYRPIDYVPEKIFDWFVNEMSDNRRKGDADKEKDLLSEVFKLLGNSAYGKFIEAVERQTRTVYTRNGDEVDKNLRSAFFEDIEEIGDAYKIELRKPKVTINRPFQVGIAVYQLAKLRMLEFYYNFLDYCLDRRDFELIQMDTHSMYFALAHDTLEEAIQAELCKGRGKRAGQDVFQGGEQEAERAALGKVRKCPRGAQGHGHQQGLPNAQRCHVHVRATQAGSFCVLLQALGAARRHPHGANRVSHPSWRQLRARRKSTCAYIE